MLQENYKKSLRTKKQNETIDSHQERRKCKI